jgi:hypothetical protein
MRSYKNSSLIILLMIFMGVGVFNSQPKARAQADMVVGEPVCCCDICVGDY